MISITTNLQSMLVRSNLRSATNGINSTIERMTTGFKLNRAKDNAAGYSIANTMSSKISSYQVAEDNVSMGLDIITTASETLELINGKLSRLRELTIQASNGTYSTESRVAILAESSSIVDEINRVYKNAEYNGQKLFDDEMTVEAPATMPQAGADGFIEAITKRDTSTMITLASVNPNTALADNTYSISTPEELKKLADMTNAGLVSAGDEFVLANDIDLSCYENWTPIGTAANRFYAEFDGNGHIIKNLTINAPDTKVVSLFGYTNNAKFKNIGASNFKIIGYSSVAGLINQVLDSTTVENCFLKNSSIMGTASGASGLCANVNSNSNVKSCYVENIALTGIGGYGEITSSFTNSTIENSFVKDLYGQTKNEDANRGGIICHANGGTINNCSVLGYTSNFTGIFCGGFLNNTRTITINNCTYNAEFDKKNLDLTGNENTVTINNTSSVKEEYKKNELQIGINSKNSSKLSVDTNLKLGVGNLYFIGIDYGTNLAISNVDSLIKLVSSKQTELGAVQNRLESVQKGINTNIMDLTSSLSTIRDADIAKESTDYIKHQILQNACATLLSTANQPPSIALSLI